MSQPSVEQEFAFGAALLDYVNDAVAAVDRDRRIIYWNAAAERLFGYSAAEVLGAKYSAVLRSTVTDDERENLFREVYERGRWEGEITCQTRGDDTIIVEISASVLPDPRGRAAGIVGIHRDVTHRRRTETALAASENRLKLAQSVLAIGTWELDLETGRSWCSDQMLRFYGITEKRDWFTREEWVERVHPDDRDRVLTELQISVEGGGAADRHFRTILADGSVRWIFSKSQVIFDSDGRPSAIIGMDFDRTEQVRAEERLRLLSAAVEQSPVSIVITGLDGTIEYINPKVSEVTGYSLEELKGQNPRLFKSGETTSDDYWSMWKTIPSGEWHGTFHNRKKSGELFWEAATIGPIRDSSGMTTHFLAVKEDITERKAMEEALRRSEERVRLITDTISEVFWMTDARLTRFLYVSSAYERVWKRTAESLYRDPRSFLEAIHPDDRDRVTQAILAGMELERPLDDEYRLLRGDGSTAIIWNRGFPVFGSNGEVTGYVGVAVDVTELRASERANAELAAIVEASDSAIISRDLHGNIITWNAGAERIFGYTAKEAIGRNIGFLVPADRAGEEAAIHEKLRSGEPTQHLETLRVTKSGQAINVLLTSSPIRDRSNTVIGAAQVAWDISHQKALQRQLAQAQKLESIGQLAAGIAHEINTPIQYVGDNGRFLGEAFRDVAKVLAPYREVVEALRSSDRPELAAQMEELSREVDVDYLLSEAPKAIRELLDGLEHVARIVRAMKAFSHPGPVEKAPLDINRAIESTILISRNEWKYVADVTTDFDPTLPPVPCVAGEFNQVILNLIVNAAHAIGDVVKERGGKGEITISTGQREGCAEIRVRDNGCGIPDEIQGKVFDPFFTTKEIGKGTGQGLSIAHAVIVQKHQGKLFFETAAGSGTTFVVQLPLETGLTA